MDLLDREEWLCYLKFPPVIQRLFFFNPIQKFSESKKHDRTTKGITKNILLPCKAEMKQPIDWHSLGCVKTNSCKAQ